jgi:hypothetical protein
LTLADKATVEITSTVGVDEAVTVPCHAWAGLELLLKRKMARDHHIWSFAAFGVLALELGTSFGMFFYAVFGSLRKKSRGTSLDLTLGDLLPYPGQL